jgi:hypothetical protein
VPEDPARRGLGEDEAALVGRQLRREVDRGDVGRECDEQDVRQRGSILIRRGAGSDHAQPAAGVALDPAPVELCLHDIVELRPVPSRTRDGCRGGKRVG